MINKWRNFLFVVCFFFSHIISCIFDATTCRTKSALFRCRFSKRLMFSCYFHQIIVLCVEYVSVEDFFLRAILLIHVAERTLVSKVGPSLTFFHCHKNLSFIFDSIFDCSNQFKNLQTYNKANVLSVIPGTADNCFHFWAVFWISIIVSRIRNYLNYAKNSPLLLIEWIFSSVEQRFLQNMHVLSTMWLLSTFEMLNVDNWISPIVKMILAFVECLRNPRKWLFFRLNKWKNRVMKIVQRIL